MKFSNIKSSVIEQFKHPRGNDVVPFILGAPGGGKSALAREIVQALGIEPINVVEFNASLRDPVDVLGLPITDGDHSRWLPPEEFYKLRQGQGRCALILEELSDASTPMQNALCRVIYDRHAGQLPLSDQLFILATGNRTEDKSGANRITTKLANRTRRFEFVEDIDDWSEWALDQPIPTELIQFLRFRPGLLSAFDANRFCNPTPRAWERVGLIPPSMPEHLLLDTIAGDVGEGAAAEYIGFKQLFSKLPNIDELLMNPETSNVPSEPSIRFAIAGALAKRSTVDNFDRVIQYASRMPREFLIMCVNDAIKRDRLLKTTRAFVEFAVKNAEVFL